MAGILLVPLLSVILIEWHFAGKTVATVNSTEQKLQDFKQDMAEGAHRPHHHPHHYTPEPLVMQPSRNNASSNV